MALTWAEFLQLAAIVTNLRDSIYYFDTKNIDIEEKNRRIAAATINYKEFFNDYKYMQFMAKVRMSFTKI